MADKTAVSAAESSHCGTLIVIRETANARPGAGEYKLDLKFPVRLESKSTLGS